MSQEIYGVALKSALAEIKSVCEGINWAFILMNNGVVIVADETATDPTIEKVAGYFQPLVEKALAVGGLNDLLVDSENGKVYVSCVNGMYLIAGLNSQANLPHFRDITHVILPTIIKVLDSITSPAMTRIPSKSVSSKPTTEEFEEKEGNKMMRVLLVATPKNVVNPYMEALKKSRIIPRIVDEISSANIRAFDHYLSDKHQLIF